MSSQDQDSRFWSKVHRTETCWEWTAFIDQSNGYGKFGVYDPRYRNKRRSEGAHRVAYRMMVGEIPEGLELDHLCRNRKCVRPDHLEAVTHRVNALRGIGVGAVNLAKTHCKRGHELTPENCLPSSAKSGYRRCRICRNTIYTLRQKERNRA